MGKAPYIDDAGLRGTCRTYIPRGLIDPKGAVPGLVRGLGHTAPTYVVGFPGSTSHDPGGSALLPICCARRRSSSAFANAGALRKLRPMQKSEVRAAALARRHALAPQVREAMAQRLMREASRIAQLARIVSDAPVVAGFWPIRGEPDCRPLLKALAGQGLQTCLPGVDGESRILRFRTWRDGDRVQQGRFGISEPLHTSPQVTPDLLIVPCAAYDGAGHRIGYGAGYYDATLSELGKARKTVAIALAFDDQRVERVSHEPHDQVMDFILTETGLWPVPLV